MTDKKTAKKTTAKKTAKKAAAKKSNPLDDFAKAVAAARKAGAQIHACIAMTDADGNTVERSF